MGQTHESSLAISSRLLFTAVHYTHTHTHTHTHTRINARYMYTSALVLTIIASDSRNKFSARPSRPIFAYSFARLFKLYRRAKCA